MHDLVGAYEHMSQVYQWYIESAFPLRYEALNEERRRLLSQQEILSQPPLLETIPVYPLSGNNLADASQSLPPDYQELQYLAHELLPPDIELWEHQCESLREVLINKRDIVVTTGTGSGKTECFLLPLLAELARDSASWPDSPEPPENRKWWNSNGGSWGGHENPWKPLLQGPHAPVPATMQRLGYGQPVQFACLRGYVHTSQQRKQIFIERHPLWTDEHPDYIAAVSSAQQQYPGHSIRPMNPFRVLRRPADYV